MTTPELDHEQQAVQTDRHLVAGRYRLHAKIGRGRLGDIYEAEDEGYRELGVGGHVAVQLLPERVALDQGLLAKLKLGYSVLRAGSHPNLVSYYDCDYDGKFGYVAMELLDGASLRFVLDDVSTLPLDEALPVVRAVGDALQFLHGKSMVHGKVSAENVFVSANLEIRLLDVVPLDSASTVLRDVASRDPFSHMDIGDDVHALACLTYEILAGKHPFNFHPPAEASRAGLEPIRIRWLSEQQWHALKRALSFDADERPATVRAFFDDFGVRGTERLRPSSPASTGRAADPVPPAKPAAPARRPQPAPLETDEAAPVAASMATRAAPRVEKRREADIGIRPFVLLALLAGICAWYFFGQPGNDIARLITIAEPYLEPAPEERVVVILPAGPTEPAPAEDNAAAPTPESAVQPDPDGELAESSEPAPSMAGEPMPAAAGEAPVNSAAAAPETGTATQDEVPGEPPMDSAAAAPITEVAAQEEAPVVRDAQPASPDSQPGNTLVRSLVTVYERDGAARVAFRRPVGNTGAVFWWTGDDTAVADADYIALEQPVVAFESGEEAETLHVPLINDSLPEPKETFYVFLGQRNAGSGRLEPIARVRVDINDDD
jgi:hypothetical protein